MTPQEKINWVKLNHGMKLNELGREIDRLLPSKLNVDKKAIRLLDISVRVTSLFQDVSPCKKGCSYCCNQAVVIFEWEAKRIEKYAKLRASQHNLKSFMDWRPEDRKKIIDSYIGVPCPFLKNNLCSIYEVRPLSCIAHVSVADDPSPCDTVNNPGAQVPYANMESLRQLWATLHVSNGEKVADIREFFPDVI